MALFEEGEKDMTIGQDLPALQFLAIKALKWNKLWAQIIS